jgi:hypothetical protein
LTQSPLSIGFTRYNTKNKHGEKGRTISSSVKRRGFLRRRSFIRSGYHWLGDVLALSLLAELLDAPVLLANEISDEIPILFVTSWLRMAA